MKKIIFSAVIAIACLTSCGTDKPKTSNDSVAVTAPSEDHAKAAKYQCPMKCEGEKTYDSAGTCPLCKMDLKEVK
jgi:ABC-type metal ion transport system substrate-binding protein